MSPQEHLHFQIIADLERLHSLIVRYASGDRERDQLEGAVQVKIAVWHAIKRR